MKLLIVFSMFLTGCAFGVGDGNIEIVMPQPIYIGCYTDTSTRALPVNLLWNGATVEACIAIAKAQGYKYAGVQYATQCFAGNEPGYTKVEDSNCDMPCTNDPQEICGGTWLNSIYATGN